MPSVHSPRRVIWVCMLNVLCVFQAAHAELPHEISACGDQNEFPPFTYLAREGGRITDRLTGYSVDYLRTLMAASGREAKITLLPWARCLALAAKGEIDIALDGVRTPTRERDFVFPSPYASMRFGYIYAKSRPAPKVNVPTDLLGLSLCGQTGYTYEMFGLPPAMTINHANSYNAAVRMLFAGRCDLLFTNREVSSLYDELGYENLLGSGKIEFAPLPWAQAIKFYLLVGRASPRRDELLEFLNREIERMDRSGETRKLTRQYLAK